MTEVPTPMITSGFLSSVYVYTDCPHLCKAKQKIMRHESPSLHSFLTLPLISHLVECLVAPLSALRCHRRTDDGSVACLVAWPFSPLRRHSPLLPSYRRLLPLLCCHPRCRTASSPLVSLPDMSLPMLSSVCAVTHLVSAHCLCSHAITLSLTLSPVSMRHLVVCIVA